MHSPSRWNAENLITPESQAKHPAPRHVDARAGDYQTPQRAFPLSLIHEIWKELAKQDLWIHGPRCDIKDSRYRKMMSEIGA
jgi:hypothetical protein